MEAQLAEPVQSTFFMSSTLCQVIIIGIIILLFFFSAFLSMLRKSIEELGKSDYEEMKERGGTHDMITIKLFKSADISVLGLFIANHILNIGIVFLGYYFLTFSGFFSWLTFLCLFFGIVLLEVIFCEKIPQYMAERDPQRFIIRWVWVAYFILFFMKPFALLVHLLTKKFKVENNSNALSDDDISEVIEIAEGGEGVEKETDMLKGIVRFGDLVVSDIMISRMDILAISATLSIDDVIRMANESGYSRIPVYEDSIDSIKGIIYVKDLLPHMIQPDNKNWIQWIRPSFFVHEHKSVSDLLRTFQEDKIHLAIVVDEYGGTSGLVTLEDIIEEIMGEITDEYDKTHTFYDKIDDKTYSFEGKTSILDFCKIWRLTDDSIFDDIRGDSETLAGLILEILGEIPEEGQEIRVKNFIFQIEKCNKRRIERICVHIER